MDLHLSFDFELFKLNVAFAKSTWNVELQTGRVCGVRSASNVVLGLQYAGEGRDASQLRPVHKSYPPDRQVRLQRWQGSHGR